MPANLAGILPSSYGRAPPAAKRSGGGEEKAEAIAKQGVTLCWCGNPADVLEVKLHPKGTVLQWIPAETPDLKVGLDPGPNKCTISNADSGFTRVISSIVVEARWREYNAGALWDEVVSEPAGRSQFSFPNGRSACSFLVCEAAKILHRRFSSATDPAAGVAPTGGALVTPALVADILTMGMALYDGGGRESLEAAGLEHCNVADVLELCGWMLKGAVSVAADGKFWGTLGDSNALLDSITMAVSASEAAFPDAPALIAITRPPETVLVVADRRSGTFGVLDTHARRIGGEQYPAAFYKCKTLEGVADVLRLNFFLLPAGLDVEELGTYAMYELTVFAVSPPEDEEENGDDGK